MTSKTIAEIVRREIENFVRERGIEIDVPVPEKPKNLQYGELCSDVPFKLSRHLQKPPEKIACELAERLQWLNPEPIGGFVNFKIPVKVSAKFLSRFQTLDILCGKRVLCEFLSANPTGPLHVGHGRIAAVGNAIANIFKFCGAEVDREFYINDAGEQIEKLGMSICGEGDQYKGEYINEIREILKNKAGGYKFAEKDFSNIGFMASQIILEHIIKRTIDRFGIYFDSFVSEREMQKYLRESLEIVKPYTYEQGGALFLKTTDFGDDKDRVLIKSNGDPTYFLNDCAYHLFKLKRGYDILVEVWGADHHGYVKRIETFLRLAKFSGEFKVRLVQMVNLIKDGKPIQMSKREGTYITLDELIDEVGVDAAKFIYLTKSVDTHLDFDVDLAKKKTTENPVYYVQYTHARVCSLFKEAELRNLLEGYEEWKKQDPWSGFEEDERKILGLCSIFPDEVIKAYNLIEPSVITSYLIDLASEYHSFYQRKRILVEDARVRFSRLFVSEVVRKTVRSGLELLGVSAPEKM